MADRNRIATSSLDLTLLDGLSVHHSISTLDVVALAMVTFPPFVMRQGRGTSISLALHGVSLLATADRVLTPLHRLNCCRQ